MNAFIMYCHRVNLSGLFLRRTFSANRSLTFQLAPLLPTPPQHCRLLLASSLAAATLLPCSSDRNREKLFRAVKQGNAKEVQKLLETGQASVEDRHPLGWTPLMLAAVNGRAEVVSVLLEAGADPNAEEEFQTVYNTARMLGVHTLEVQAAREEDFSSRLSPRANFRGCTALHYAALTGLTSGRYPDYAIYDQCFQPVESIQASLCIHSLQTAGVLFHSC